MAGQTDGIGRTCATPASGIPWGPGPDGPRLVEVMEFLDGATVSDVDVELKVSSEEDTEGLQIRLLHAGKAVELLMNRCEVNEGLDVILDDEAGRWRAARTCSARAIR